MCKGINANGRGVDGLFCFWLPLFSLPSSCCLHPSLETETLPEQPGSEEESETGNSVGFRSENNVGGTQMSTATSLSALQ